MEHYLGVARDKGVSEGKINAVQGIAMAVCAGRVNAQMRRIQTNSKK